MLVVPAVNDGLKGSGAEHGLPFGPETTSNVELESLGSLPDHGTIAAVVVYPPHNAGVDSGAREPPKKWSFRSSNGSCGVFLNVVTSCPVTGSGLTSPASFTSTPDTGSCATRYRATRLPNGFAFCAARYAAPVSGFGNNGDSISSVPTFAASGHDGNASTDKATCSSLQAASPSAADGFSATPAGNVTVVSFTSASDSPSPFRLTSCGTCTPTVNPVGVLPACPSGATSIDGLNGSWLQPSIPTGRPRLSWKVYSKGEVKTPSSCHESASSVVCTGPVHDVGSASNGGGVACPKGLQGGWCSSGLMQFHPRTESWRGSPGTPQNVTRLEMNPEISVMLGTVTVTP